MMTIAGEQRLPSIASDIIQRKKLESLGVLAGGIAHDFNNLLTSVVGNISHARMDMTPGSKGFKNLIEAEKASIKGVDCPMDYVF